MLTSEYYRDPKLSVAFPKAQNLPPSPAPSPQPSQQRPRSHHRRRQSSKDKDDVPKRKKSVLQNLPGQYEPGMEHAKQLTDVLYERWTMGLRSRWTAL